MSGEKAAIIDFHLEMAHKIRPQLYCAMKYYIVVPYQQEWCRFSPQVVVKYCQNILAIK